MEKPQKGMTIKLKTDEVKEMNIEAIWSWMYCKPKVLKQLPTAAGVGCDPFCILQAQVGDGLDESKVELLAGEDVKQQLFDSLYGWKGNCGQYYFWKINLKTSTGESGAQDTLSSSTGRQAI